MAFTGTIVFLTIFSLLSPGQAAHLITKRENCGLRWDPATWTVSGSCHLKLAATSGYQGYSCEWRLMLSGVKIKDMSTPVSPDTGSATVGCSFSGYPMNSVTRPVVSSLSLVSAHGERMPAANLTLDPNVRIRECGVHLNTEDWTVSGWCEVATANVQCRWINDKSWKQTSMATVGKDGQGGVCRFHEYRLFLASSSVDFISLDAGGGGPGTSIPLLAPGPPQLKNCPESVVEGSDVTCLCAPTPAGSPPALVTWSPEPHTQNPLRLRDVRNASTFTCRVYWKWKDVDAGSISYTVFVHSNASTVQPYTAVHETFKMREDSDDVDDSHVIAVTTGAASVIVISIIVIIVLVVFVVVSKRRKELQISETKHGQTAKKCQDDDFVEEYKNYLYVSADDLDTESSPPPHSPSTSALPLPFHPPPKSRGSAEREDYENFSLR